MSDRHTPLVADLVDNKPHVVHFDNSFIECSAVTSRVGSDSDGDISDCHTPSAVSDIIDNYIHVVCVDNSPNESRVSHVNLGDNCGVLSDINSHVARGKVVLSDINSHVAHDNCGVLSDINSHVARGKVALSDINPHVAREKVVVDMDTSSGSPDILRGHCFHVPLIILIMICKYRFLITRLKPQSILSPVAICPDAHASPADDLLDRPAVTDHFWSAYPVFAHMYEAVRRMGVPNY